MKTVSGGDCVEPSRGTIEANAMEQQGNLGLPGGEIVAARQSDGQLICWLELDQVFEDNGGVLGRGGHCAEKKRI